MRDSSPYVFSVHCQFSLLVQGPLEGASEGESRPMITIDVLKGNAMDSS